jgi:hypothetical protein
MLRHLPNGASLAGISVEEVWGIDNALWPWEVFVGPKSFRILLLEERPWLPSARAGEMERLELSKNPLIGSTMGERKLFLEVLELGALLFAMFMTVRDNDVDLIVLCERSPSSRRDGLHKLTRCVTRRLLSRDAHRSPARLRPLWRQSSIPKLSVCP